MRSLALPRVAVVRPASPWWALAGAVAALTALLVLAAVLGEDFPPVLLALTLAVALAGLFDPFTALLGAVVVSPTFAWVVAGPDLSPFQVLVAGASLGALGAVAGGRGIPVRRLARRPEVVLAAAFVAWVAIAFSAHPEAGDLRYVRNYAGSLAVLLLVAALAGERRRRLIVAGALIAGTTATGIVGLAQIVSTDALVGAWVLPHLRGFQDQYLRLASPWGLAAIGSDYSKDVLVGLLIGLPLLTAVRGRPRMLLGAALVVLALGLAMSGSRSAWLAGVVGLGYAALTLRRSRPVALASLGLACVLAAMILRPAAPAELQAAVGLPDQAVTAAAAAPTPGPGTKAAPRAVGGARDQDSVDISNAVRGRLNRAGLRMVRANPVVGVGPGAFPSQVDRYAGPAPDGRPRQPAHNVFVSTWAETGTPGVLLYVGFLATVLLGLERRRRSSAGVPAALAVGVAAALMGHVVTSAFHNYQFDNLLWILCGLATAMAVWPEPEVTGAT